jgi:hypothetical protein
MRPTTPTGEGTHQQAPRPLGRAALVAIGGVCGLAWATGLRGFMAEVAGFASGVEWVGTFVWILAPGVLTGALLGWAQHLRRAGGRRGWRWLAAAPLLFAGVLVYGVATAPGGPVAGLEEFFADGLGGGAIGVPLFGMAGGYALSGRGRPWGRLLCGVIALTPIPIWALTVTGFGGPGLAVTTPRGLWVALYFWSFLAVLALGCAIPHRPVITPPGRRPPSRATTRQAADPTRAPVA